MTMSPSPDPRSSCSPRRRRYALHSRRRGATHRERPRQPTPYPSLGVGAGRGRRPRRAFRRAFRRMSRRVSLLGSQPTRLPVFLEPTLRFDGLARRLIFQEVSNLDVVTVIDPSAALHQGGDDPLRVGHRHQPFRPGPRDHPIGQVAVAESQPGDVPAQPLRPDLVPTGVLGQRVVHLDPRHRRTGFQHDDGSGVV